MEYGADAPLSASEILEKKFIEITELFEEGNSDAINFKLGSRDPYGWTPLHYIMVRKDIEIEFFLQKIQPEVLEETLLKRTEMGVIPFQQALEHQSDSNCEQLIKRISPDTVCKIMLTKTGNDTPLEYALMYRPHVANLLLNKLTTELFKNFFPLLSMISHAYFLTTD